MAKSGVLLRLLPIAAVCVLIPKAAWGFDFTTLDFPGATGTVPAGISGGVVTGRYLDSHNASHGFVYANGTFTTLDYPGATETYPTGISGNVIIGSYVLNNTSYAFLYSAGSFSTLNLPGGVIPSALSGGTYAGSYGDGNFGDRHGFTYTAGTLTTIDDPAGYNTTVGGIDGSRVVGSFTTGALTSQTDHGFVFDGASFTQLDYPLGDPSYSTDVNGISGDNIVGIYSNGTIFHGFLFDGAHYTTVDDPLGVGDFDNGDSTTILSAVSGNTAVGWYVTADGALHGLMVTVPEPGLLAFAPCAFLLIRRRNRRQASA